MASGIIHLAIIEKICEEYRCKDRARLNFGAVLPDFSGNRNKAHFRAVVWDRNKQTYDLTAFREKFGDRIFDDDLYLGYYLHLVQDILYRNYVYKRYHWDPTVPGNVERLHNDYSILNGYVREHYKLSNDLVVPESFEREEVNSITEFYPKEMIAEMDSFFTKEGIGDIFFFTREMADEYIAEAVQACLGEMEALLRGDFMVDSYALAW